MIASTPKILLRAGCATEYESQIHEITRDQLLLKFKPEFQGHYNGMFLVDDAKAVNQPTEKDEIWFCLTKIGAITHFHLVL